eukprot:scaffold5346_cov80-Skeletonema_marinoi.AAC.1
MSHYMSIFGDSNKHAINVSNSKCQATAVPDKSSTSCAFGELHLIVIIASEEGRSTATMVTRIVTRRIISSGKEKQRRRREIPTRTTSTG